MLFYWIEAATAADREPEDRAEQAAHDLQAKEDAFFQKRGRKAYLFVSEIKRRKIIAGALLKDTTPIEDLLSPFFKALELDVQVVKAEETTLSVMKSLMRAAERSDYIDTMNEVLTLFDLDDLNGRFSRFSEDILDESRSKKELLREADSLLCSETLQPEIERIYQGASHQVRCGHPVHYLIQTDSAEVRERMVGILLSALYSNQRIGSKRYCQIQLESCARPGSVFRVLYNASQDGTMVVTYSAGDENDDEYASTGTGTVLEICEKLKQYKHQVLTILCLPRSCEKIKHLLLENLDTVTLLELREDAASGDRAKAYLRCMAKNCGIPADRGLYQGLQDPGKTFLASQLNHTFDSWYSDRLKTRIYTQYADTKAANRLVQHSRPKGSAYDELQRMIGLGEAKAVIQQALDYYKAQKLFRDRGMGTDHTAMHMVFTGNPGTAKTTVARLFAAIMKDNGLLSVGDLIEVGRADLVGKYVGWTAPTVKKKFAEAQGSVLFIDEAYSLVDDRDGLYGDEAINTIVQEMENRREDMVVIFAGYPDKMEGFLQKNPGLRSRIAFHVPFADYSVEELYRIAALMAENSHMRLSADVQDRLLPVFETAVRDEDFGNGRFVRNLLEKARMKQASRLVGMDIDAVTREDVSTLTAADFDSPQPEKPPEKRRIGF